LRIARLLIGLACLPASVVAQATQAGSAPAAAQPLPDAQQIAAAVLPLPAEFRDDAQVLGYHAGSAQLVTLRDGKGPFTCLATNPATPRFHVACYHKSLEAFMARGRALRAQGVPDEKVDTVRFAEVKSGKLVMPKQATLYQLFGPPGAFDPATGTAKGASALFVNYMPGATTASTGLSAKPAEGAPWIMYPGTPKAHIMLTSKM
jgi:hypothetical protein